MDEVLRLWRLLLVGARLLAAALAQRLFSVAIRLARAGHQLPVDDRVRLALPFEARAADRRVDGVRGRLLGVEEADVVELAARVPVIRLESTLPCL